MASSSSEAPKPVSVVAENLTVPWAIGFLPSGDLLVTERGGRVVRIGQDRKTYPIAGVRETSEGGLLGLALHPGFARTGWVYLYLTGEKDGTIENRIERYTLENDTLTQRTVIFDAIPAASRHDGGRIAFGPDEFLYITTGDATEDALAQDMQSLAGKILRIRDDGTIPSDNPFGNAVYSYGHRNAQGIAWDDEGRLWETEHGRSIPLSGYDELNLIEKGGNYGWPEVQGDETREGMIAPVLHSGPYETWAPASAAFLDGSIYFGGLRGAALFEARVEDGGIPELRVHLDDYGRIREVIVGPDGYLYVTTSNRDGRGSPRPGDDRILRVDPDLL